MDQSLPSAAALAALPPDGGPEFNRLIFSASPYLRQHARNPVDWRPWGEEALALARESDRPIFLSVGYSTCHWCHVMARESFEDPAIAELLNAHFVPVKVDREERPDLDEIYMLATQMLTGAGGWPMSVWLTPEGRPFFAGTYFPPEDLPGRPGFRRVLAALAEVWGERREELERQAAAVVAALERAAAPGEPGEAALDRDLVRAALVEVGASFDESHGGFGPAPKFPPHATLALLLYEYARTGEAPLERMLRTTLDALARGGLRDHLGGGFHRYSTDPWWRVPHFEKMLYDNAQLARSFSRAAAILDEPEYDRVAAETLDWALGEMRDPAGGFYAALDADAEGEEGRFYLWTPEEIRAVLGAEAGARFCRVYQVQPEGNFPEEGRGIPAGRSVLSLAGSLAEAAAQEELSEQALQEELTAGREALLTARERRVRPGRDEKVLTAWNGLLLTALAEVGRRQGASRFLEAGRQAAEFLLSALRPQGRLRAAWTGGETSLAAYLDDYAFLVEGLLELAEATGEGRWRTAAEELVTELRAYCEDPAGGFFFTAADQGGQLVRLKRPYDQALPAGNGVAARVLVKLAQLTGQEDYAQAARGTLYACAGAMQANPRATETLLLALAEYLDSGRGDLAPPGDPLSVAAPARRLTLNPGAATTLALTLTLAEGWHLSAGGETPAVRVQLREGEDLALAEVSLPPAQPAEEGGPVYRGSLEVTLRLGASATARPGLRSVRLALSAAPCGEGRCLPEATREVVLEVEVTAAAGTGAGGAEG